MDAANPLQISLDSSKRKTLGVVALTVLVVAGLVILWKLLPMTDYVRTAAAFIDDSGPVGIVVFYVLYILFSLIGIPRTLVNISAGFLFSFPVAIVTVLLAAGTAYSLTFLIARTVAREWVEKRVARLPNVQCLIDMVNEEGFKVVFLIRMNPFIPAVIKGYGLGTTRIPFRTYLSASLLGFLPLSLAHVYLGWVGGEAMLDPDGGPSVLQSWILLGGGIASIVLVGVFYYYGKRAMNSRFGAT